MRGSPEGAARKGNEMDNLNSVLPLIQNKINTLGSGVVVEYQTVQYSLVPGMRWYDELIIKVTSPHLKYHKIHYATGGDSIVTGVTIENEYTKSFRYAANGEFVVGGVIDHVMTILAWAEELGRGEEVKISDEYSQNYLRSKGLGIIG